MYKRILTIAGAAVLVFGLAQLGTQAIAQSGSAGGAHKGRRERMSPDRQLGRLSETLNLTDDQKGQIRPILEERSQKMQSLRADSSLAADDKRAKMRGIFEDSNSRIRAVLNDVQKQKFDEMQQRRHERMEKHEATEKK
ncbi:MAG: hypothetical protein ACYDA9_12060 [Terriglobia bacterium]